jgi:hypothetical protein
MKFGLRIPSLKKRIAARTSLKRFVCHSLGCLILRLGLCGAMFCILLMCLNSMP